MSADRLQTLQEAWGILVAHAWDDPDVERQLLEDPRQLLAERGLELPERLAIKVVRTDRVEPTQGVLYLPYPAPPAQELSDDELDAVNGGSGIVAPRAMDSSGLGEIRKLQAHLGLQIQSLNPILVNDLLHPGPGFP